MSRQTRSVPVEEVQKIQKSLWRQSSAVKDAIRDAAGRVLEHVRSRETFLLEQVELLEHAKFEMLMDNLFRDDIESDADADMNEAIVEFAAMELGVEAGFRSLCDAIAQFGPEMLKDELKEPQRQRKESGGSSLESDFCVLDDDSCLVRESVQSTSGESDAVLEKSPLSEWLLNEDGARVAAFQSFFGEVSRYALDYGYWLKEGEAEEEMDEEREEEEEEEEEKEDSSVAWKKWVHPSSLAVDVVDGAEEATFFSEHIRYIRQSSLDEWIVKDTPAALSEIRIPVAALNRFSALTTTPGDHRSADGWLLNSRPAWHENHPHHYGECADSCRALSDQDDVEMEIENIGNLSCLNETPKNGESDDDDALSQWLLKPKKGKIAVKGRRSSTTTTISDWLLDEGNGSSSSSTTARSLRSQSDAVDWLKTTEEDLVKGLCKANEPCAGFSGCLSDINCKKGKKDDDEEKEKEDEDKEDEGSSTDDGSDDWVMPKKRGVAVPSRPAAREEKISQFLKAFQATTQDFWLTS